MSITATAELFPRPAPAARRPSAERRGGDTGGTGDTRGPGGPGGPGGSRGSRGSRGSEPGPGSAPAAPGAPSSPRAGSGPVAGPPVSRTVVQLLEAARDELRAAQRAGQPAERFCSAHLGALRAAAAVLALRARPRRPSRPADAWTLLSSVAPEYAEWAAFFAAHSATRSAIEAGIRGRVTQRDADDMVRQADLFLALVTRTAFAREGG